MKKIFFLGVFFMLMGSLAFAQYGDMPAAMDKIMLKGVIIDNACAGAHKDDLAGFVLTHTKECALQPACVASGYSIFADGKLMKFDSASNAKIADFLKVEGNKLNVDVEVNKAGEELSLVSIVNKK